MAELSSRTQNALAGIVPPTGTSLRNPVDVGLTASLDMDIYVQSARTIAADPGVDTLVVVGIGLTPETNQLYTKSMIQAREDFQKPFVMVGIPGFEPGLARTFCEAGLPFFETAERAMGTYSMVRRYQLWREHMEDSLFRNNCLKK
jgi:acyl-CoA synthetase (NDP forming)